LARAINDRVRNQKGDFMNRIFKLVTAAALFAVCSIPATAGSDISPADKKALHDYTLSMDKVKGMGAAMADLHKAGAGDSSLAAQAKAIGDTSKSVGEMIGRVNANPKLMAICRAHGLSAADFVLMPFALMYAGMAVAYPSAAGKLADETSPAQIAFYKQNQAALTSMPWLSGK
jgi:hypothetical protein